MYPNLFKQIDLPKLYNGLPKQSDASAQIEDCETKVPDEIQNEEKYPELTIKTFFDFMRTAYQVNSSFEELAATLTANSEIDWSALVKTSLDRDDATKKIEDNNNDGNKADKNSQTVAQKEPSKITKTINNESSITANNEHDDLKNSGETHTRDVNVAKSINTTSSILAQNDPNDNGTLLAKVMKGCLSDVLHEGILDSVLPYMLPKTVLSQPVMKKPQACEAKNTISAPIVCENRAVFVGKDKDKGKQKRYTDAEVEIHVCDEAKNIKKDFRCPQKLLIQKMCYFADVTAGQKLEEMDISVHCDLVIFDWLMRWVKKETIKKSEWPSLEAKNVIPIMVSASFLQMEPLIKNCIDYCHDNINDVLKTSAVMSCLNDDLLTRLADSFANAEIEAITDKKDKIQSRLFCKLIASLSSTRPDNARGHFGTLATLFRCAKCEKYVVRSVSDTVPCVPGNTRIDARGDLHSKHTRDLTWSLNDYIVDLRAELRSWRKVYWRLWGDCHFLYCKQCGVHFPINQMNWCSYHPDNPQYFINEQQRTTPFPLGRYPCCSQRAYRFQAITNRDGCKFREHVPNIVSETEENIVNLFLAYRDIISLEIPQMFFPEKITRLVARDSTLSPGKLACKETFWWEGIEILPSRPKLGLLAKIWGGSGIRKSCQISTQRTKKLSRQVSETTEASSAVSSDSCSDGDEEQSNSNSSLDEDSSEESHDWATVETLVGKKKKASKILKRCEGMGLWSSNLSMRYNQDNQRDAEEKAGAQMIALLSKRTMLEHNIRHKSHSISKHNHWNNNFQPIGGTYVKLEAEFLNQVTQVGKCKNTSVKGSTRIKSSK